jgi:hypothetical protein
MNDLQTSTRSFDYRVRNAADLVTLGDAAKPTRSSRRTRRRELLHDAAIITVGLLICGVAICIIYTTTPPWLPDAAPMANWLRGLI